MISICQPAKHIFFDKDKPCYCGIWDSESQMKRLTIAKASLLAQRYKKIRKFERSCGRHEIIRL